MGLGRGKNHYLAGLVQETNHQKKNKDIEHLPVPLYALKPIEEPQDFKNYPVRPAEAYYHTGDERVLASL